MLIKEIMSPKVEFCTPGTTLVDAAREMRKREIGFLPVGDNDRLIGMVTDRDIVVRGLAAGHDPQIATLKEVMSPEVLYLFEDQTVEEAAESLARNAVRRMPVVDREKRLTGVIALGDLSRQGLKAEVADALEEIATAA